MNRRAFIQGIAGLAALAITPNLLAKDKLVIQTRLEKLIQSGLVQDEVFYCKSPILLRNIKNLVIKNCTFIFADQIPANISMIEIEGTCESLVITSCNFQTHDHVFLSIKE